MAYIWQELLSISLDLAREKAVNGLNKPDILRISDIVDEAKKRGIIRGIEGARPDAWDESTLKTHLSSHVRIDKRQHQAKRHPFLDGSGLPPGQVRVRLDCFDMQ